MRRKFAVILFEFTLCDNEPAVLIVIMHSDLNEFETAFAKFQLCMDFF